MAQSQPILDSAAAVPVSSMPDFLHAVLATIAAPIVVKDRDHRWVLINDAFCQMLGYGQSHFIGKSVWDVLPNAQAETIWSGDEHAFVTGVAQEDEEVWLDANGFRKRLGVKKSIITDASGQPFLVSTLHELVVPVEDIQTTEQWMMQPLPQVVMDNLPQAIFWKDCNSVYLGCNQAFATLVGLASPEFIVGKTDYELGWSRAEADLFRERDRQVLETEQPLLGIIEPFQAVDATPSWLEVSKVPLHDSAGCIIGILGTFQDVTQRQQVEDALRQSEATNRALIDAVPALLIRMQGDGTYLDVVRNGSFKPIDPMNALCGVNIYELLPHELAAQRMMYAQRALDTGDLQIYEQELDIRGETCYEEVRIVPSSDREVLIMIHDVTARKRAELALQHLNEELEKQIESRTSQLKKVITRLEQEVRDRKKIEKALRRSQQTLQLVIDTFPQRIFWKDRDYRYLGCNKLFAQDAGLESPEQIIGLTDFDLAWKKSAAVYQTEDEAVMEHHQLRLDHEQSYTRKDGSTLWLRMTKIPLKNEEQLVIGLLGAYEDISARKQAEAALSESEARFRQLADNIEGYFWLLDQEGHYLYVSPGYEKIWQRSCETLYHNPNDWLEALHPEDRDRLIQAEAQQWDNGYDVEYRIIRPDKQVLWIRDRAFPVRDADGQVYRMAGIADDITVRKQAEEALQQSEAQLRQQAQDLEKALQDLRLTQAQLVQSEKMSSLGQLVAGVAHEINNPVNFIYGNLKHAREYTQNLLALLYLYQEHYPQPVEAIQDQVEAIDLEFLVSDLPRLLNSMKVGAERIHEIVMSLRTFSRMDEADMKAVDIHASIDSTIMILQNRLRANSSRPEIRVFKDYAELPLVECYAGQLNQVFMNILSNAIDALEEGMEQGRWPMAARLPLNSNEGAGPCIKINTKLLSSGHVAIHIADNGLGVSEGIRMRLFDPFFTTKPIGKGTGMGLSISYQIVTERHGGSLQCLSQPGEGTEFIITIPLQQLIPVG